MSLLIAVDEDTAATFSAELAQIPAIENGCGVMELGSGRVEGGDAPRRVAWAYAWPESTIDYLLWFADRRGYDVVVSDRETLPDYWSEDEVQP
jgi:hypothetical protein